jgi:hypothetical protein
MGWVINTMPRALYPSGRPGTHCTGGWVDPSTGLGGGKNLAPHRVSISGPSARSESLYRLSYPGPDDCNIRFILLSVAAPISQHLLDYGCIVTELQAWTWQVRGSIP